MVYIDVKTQAICQGTNDQKTLPVRRISRSSADPQGSGDAIPRNLSDTGRTGLFARPRWEIKRSDLEEEPVCSIIERLKKTGKLDLAGDRSDLQPTLFE